MALWEQKIAREVGVPVVWDYHVILVLRARKEGKHCVPELDKSSRVEADQKLLEETEYTGYLAEIANAWVYDFDTSITPVPCQWSEYVTRTFPCKLIPQYQSLFRVIPGEQFINVFASDRSHMLLPEVEGQAPNYFSPPPIYDPICGMLAKTAGITNNLMKSFVCMDPVVENTYGDVLSLEEVMLMFCFVHEDVTREQG